MSNAQHPTSMTDLQMNAWARTALAGDQDAYDHLYDPLTRLAWASLKPMSQSQDCEEAISNAWVAVLTGKAKYDGVRHFRPWFVGVAINKLKSARHQTMRSQMPQGADDAPFHDLIAPKEEEDGFAKADWMLKVRTCWQRLDLEDRTRICKRFPQAPAFLSPPWNRLMPTTSKKR